MLFQFSWITSDPRAKSTLLRKTLCGWTVQLGGYCDWSKCCNSSVAPGGAASSWMVVFNWRTGASEVVSSVRSDSSFQQVESLVVDVCEPQEADAHADNQAVRAGQGESVAIVPINHSAHVSMCHVGSGRHPKYCCRLTIVGGGGHAIPFGHVFGKTAQVRST